MPADGLGARNLMSRDITNILDGWPFEPGQVIVRKVAGDDGREKIQMRLDLGLLQMETSGRPDGDRPYGRESLLDHYEHQLRRHKQANGTDAGFALDEKACETLRGEAVMYYHRYLAQFVLEDFKAVQRDTRRNLRVMDLCNAYAAEPSDRLVLEQYRPYVVMMCTRARAQEALCDQRPKQALTAVREGIAEIEAFSERFGGDLAGEPPELTILSALAREVQTRIPLDPLSKLQSELELAGAEERYEDAAGLRDMLTRDDDPFHGPID